MNLAIKKKELKTADGYPVKEGEVYFYLEHQMFGATIKKFKCIYWTSGGKSKVKGEQFEGKSYEYIPKYKGFYPEKESNPFSVIYYGMVYKEFDNAVKAYNKRIKKMSKMCFDEKSVKLIQQSHD